MKKSLLVATMLAAVAAAQAGPLDGLLYNVRGLVGTVQQIAVAPPAPAPAAPPPSTAVVEAVQSDLPPAAEEVIRALAATAAPTYEYVCQNAGTRDTSNLARSRFERREWPMAAAAAKEAASFMSACRRRGVPVYSNDVELIGRLLALSAIAGKNGGLVSGQTVWEAQAAMTLLKLTPGTTQEQITKLEEADLLPVKADESGPVETITLDQLIAKYKSNSFGLFRQYGGKTIAVTAYVHSVSGSAKSASISARATRHVNPNASILDTMICFVQDPGSIDAAGRLQKDEKIEMIGVLKENKTISGIVLHDCRLKP